MKIRQGMMMLGLLPALVFQAYAEQAGFVLNAEWTAGQENPAVVISMSISKGYFLYADQFRVTDGAGRELEAFGPLPIHEKKDPFSGAPVQVLSESFQARYPLPDDAEGSGDVTVAYQGCNESTCFMPQRRTFHFSSGHEGSGGQVSGASPEPEEAPDSASPDWRAEAEAFRPVASATGYMPTKTFLDFLARAGRGEAEQALGERRVWVAVWLILLGGLALNLTPCVLPMLPVNLAIIGAGAQAGSRRRGFLLGGAYGLGIALAYGGTGLVVVLTGATFGGLNANAWFNGIIALLFLILALGMFDVIHIDLARFQRAGGAPGRRGGLLVALGMGMVSALLAGACVAPVVISVLLWSGQLYADGHYSGLLLPFVLGAGMALPWPFAGAGLSLLPRPGGWMVWVRNGFGVLILLLALYYGYQAYVLSGAGPVTDSGHAGGASGGPDAVNAQLAAQLRAAAAEQRPVLLDFGAAWCKNCKTMKHTTLQNAEVLRALEGFVFIYYAAENPDDPQTKAVLDYFGVLGLPTYVLLEPLYDAM